MRYSCEKKCVALCVSINVSGVLHLNFVGLSHQFTALLIFILSAHLSFYLLSHFFPYPLQSLHLMFTLLSSLSKTILLAAFFICLHLSLSLDSPTTLQVLIAVPLFLHIPLSLLHLSYLPILFSVLPNLCHQQWLDGVNWYGFLPITSQANPVLKTASIKDYEADP